MITFSTGSISTTVKNFNNLKVTERVAALKCLEAAGAIWQDAVADNISYTDHTLSDLARLGHPYAKKRHAKIKIHEERPYVVHKHEGKLLGGLEGSVRELKTRGAFYRLRIRNKGKVPGYIIKGTKIMHGRNVIELTGHEPETQKKMMKAIISVLGKELRSGAVIRFDASVLSFK